MPSQWRHSQTAPTQATITINPIFNFMRPTVISCTPSASPLVPPSPSGRGGNSVSRSTGPTISESSTNGRRFSLSTRERAGVRGNETRDQKPLQSYRIVIAVLFVLGSVMALTTGCGHSHAQQAPPTPTVTVAPAERKEIVEWDEFTGRTEAVEAVDVRPRVSGYIQGVRFQSGQLVKKGDVLFVIERRLVPAWINDKEHVAFLSGQ